MKKIESVFGFIVAVLLLAGYQQWKHEALPVDDPRAAAERLEDNGGDYGTVLVTLMRFEYVEFGGGWSPAPPYLNGAVLRRTADGEWLFVLPWADELMSQDDLKRFVSTFWRAYREAPIPSVKAIYLGMGGGKYERASLYRMLRVSDLHGAAGSEERLDALVQRWMGSAETVSAAELDREISRNSRAAS